MKVHTLIWASMFFVTALHAQNFKSLQQESTMTISGTSTLHDWTSEVESFEATVLLKGENIETAGFKAQVQSIKSGTTAMDKNTYKAMKEDQYPSIAFQASNITINNGETKISGQLTIAGHSEGVQFPVKIERWSESHLMVEGSYALKMSDYGIDPPRAMMGTIRTGDEVVIAFKLNLYH